MDENAIKDDKSDDNTAKNLSKSDSRFTRSRTYSLDLFSTNHGTLAPRPPGYSYSGKRLVKHYPSNSRASSVPISPGSHPKPISRSSSANKSSSTQKIEDKNSARRLIQNLVTIFSHSRSPGSSSMMKIKKEIVSSGDSSRESSITAQPAAFHNETLYSIEQSLKKEPIDFSSDSTETESVPALGEDDVHTFHTPISSPSPASDTGLDNSLAVDDLANCTPLNEPTINEVENDDFNEPVNSSEQTSLHQEYSTEDCGLVQTSDDFNKPVNSSEQPSLHQAYSTENCGLVRTSDDSNKPVNSSEQTSLHQEYSTEDCGLVRTSDDFNKPVNSSEQTSLHQEYSTEDCGLVRTSDDFNKPVNSSEQTSLHQAYSTKDCSLVQTSDDFNKPVNSSEQTSLHQELSTEDCGLVQTSDDFNKPVNSSEQPSLHQELSTEDCSLVQTSDDSNKPVNSSEQTSLHQEYSTEDCSLVRTSDDFNKPVNSSEQTILHQEFSTEDCSLVRTSDDSNKPVNSSEQTSLHQEFSTEDCGLVRTSNDFNKPVNSSEQPSLHQEFSTEDCSLVRTSNTVIPVPMRGDEPILSSPQVSDECEANVTMNQVTTQEDKLSEPVTAIELDKPIETPRSESPTPMDLNEAVTSEDPTAKHGVATQQSPPTLEGVLSEDDMSETTLSAMSGEEYDLPQPIKDAEQKSSITGTGKASKARRLIAKAKVSRRQDNELKSKRKSHSKKKVKHKKSKQFSPPPSPKRSRYDNSSPVRSQSKPQAKPTPPKGNVLASILTDIPEVDICPLSAHKTTPIASVAKHISGTHRSKIQLEPANAQQQRLTRSKLTRSKDQLPPRTVHTHTSWNKEDGVESDHHKLLMRWEKDLALGTNALTAPMLYAMEHIPDILNTKSPWIKKAKVVWSVWRRKVKPEEKKVYLKKARDNRANARNVSKQNKINDPSSTVPEETESEEEEEELLSPSSSSVKTLTKDDTWTVHREINDLEITPNAPSNKPQSSFQLNQPLPNFQAKPTSVLATPASIKTQPFSNPLVSATPTVETVTPTPPVYIPFQISSCNPVHLSPSTSQWQGIVPLQIPSAIIQQMPAKEKLHNREPTKRLSSIGHTSFSLNDILATKLPSVARSPSELGSPQFSELKISTHTMLPFPTVTPVSNYTGQQFINTSGHIPTCLPLLSRNKSTPSYSITTHKPSPSTSTGGTKDKTKKETKIRKKEGLSSRLSSQMPLASPSFVIPQLDQRSHNLKRLHPQSTMQAHKLNTYGQISISPGHNARSGKYSAQQATPPSHAHSYVIPSMLLSGPRMSSPLEVTVSVPSGGSRSRSVSVSSSSGRSASLTESPQLPPSSYTPDHNRYLHMKQGGKKPSMKPQQNEVPTSFSMSSAFPMPSPSTPFTYHSAQTTPSTTHTATPTSPLSPSSYYNSNQYKLSILKKINEFHEMQALGSDSHHSSTQRTNPSVKIEAPSMNFTQQNSHPMVVQPAVRFNEEVDTPSPSEPAPLTENSMATPGPSSSPSTPSPVKPSLMVNAAYVGDFSSMSLWEMEQLYAFNKAALYRQKKITKVIRAQLIKMQQEERVSHNQKLSRSDLYKRFLHFLVQPNFTPSCDLIKGCPTPLTKMDVLDTSFDRPVLKKEFDKYGSLSTTAKA